MLRLAEGSKLFSYCVSKIIAQEMLDCLRSSLDGMGFDEDPLDKAVISYRKELNEELEVIFPDNYPQASRLDLFIGLYSLLIAEEEFVPTLPMEYVMYQIILGIRDFLSDRIEMAGDIDKFAEELYNEYTEEERKQYFDLPNAGGIGLPENVLKELREEWSDLGDPEDEEMSKDILKDALYAAGFGYKLENYCFWDYDFKFLDGMTMAGIRNSEYNEMLGIAEDSACDNFILPENWLEDRGFQYEDGHH